ncbi:MAG: flagellar hook-length control protein FliK [Candidatus Hydrogenedentes bacterium]|nr:flagellar hook-length control protein FliK [Candidatus Hydrogenedentota bacterium]
MDIPIIATTESTSASAMGAATTSPVEGKKPATGVFEALLQALQAALLPSASPPTVTMPQDESDNTDPDGSAPLANEVPMATELTPAAPDGVANTGALADPIPPVTNGEEYAPVSVIESAGPAGPTVPEIESGIVTIVTPPLQELEAGASLTSSARIEVVSARIPDEMVAAIPATDSSAGAAETQTRSGGPASAASYLVAPRFDIADDSLVALPNVKRQDAPAAVRHTSLPEGASTASPSAQGGTSDSPDDTVMLQTAPTQQRLDDDVLARLALSGVRQAIQLRGGSELSGRLEENLLSSGGNSHAPPQHVVSALAFPTQKAEVAIGTMPAHALPERATLAALNDVVVRAVEYFVSRSEKTLRIQLVPESLGELRVEISSSGEILQVRLASASPVVRDMLESQVTHLRDTLTRNGMNVGSVVVGAGGAMPHGAPGHNLFQDWTGPPERFPWFRTGTLVSVANPIEVTRYLAAPHEGRLNVFV